MAGLFGVIKKAVAAGDDAVTRARSASSPVKKFKSFAGNPEQSKPTNTPPLIRSLVGEGGIDNLRPIILTNNVRSGVDPSADVFSDQEFNALIASVGANLRTGASVDVDDTVDRIDELLDGNVSKGEINEAIDLISGLDASEANAVFDQLNDRGLINPLIKEIYDGSFFGDRDVDDNVRQEFFDNIAGKLDGENLARVTDGLRAVSNNSVEGRPEIGEFTDSIVEHADERTKIEYVGAINDKIPTEPNDRLLPHRNAHAISAARVIASLADNPENVRQALDRLDSAQERTVINEAVNAEELFPSDPSQALYTPIANAVSQLGDRPEETLVKAEFFELSGLELARNRKDLSETLERGMTKILLTDTNGIIEELAYGNSTSVNSDALSEYIEQLIKTDKTEVVAEVHTQLLLGNDLSGDHRDRFDQQSTILGGSDLFFTNANKLGYFAGSVERAVDNIEGDAAAKRERVVEILTLGLGVINPVLGAGAEGPARGIILSQSGRLLTENVERLIGDEGLTFDKLLLEASLPANSRGGRAGDSDANQEFEIARDNAREGG